MVWFLLPTVAKYGTKYKLETQLLIFSLKTQRGHLLIQKKELS
jgi:hypothetical protein